MIKIIIIVITIVINIMFILVYVLVAGGSSETRRAPTLVSVNEVDALLELGAGHTLAVVNVLLGEGRLRQNHIPWDFFPKHTNTRIDRTSGQS